MTKLTPLDELRILLIQNQDVLPDDPPDGVSAEEWANARQLSAADVIDEIMIRFDRWSERDTWMRNWATDYMRDVHPLHPDGENPTNDSYQVYDEAVNQECESLRDYVLGLFIEDDEEDTTDA